MKKELGSQQTRIEIREDINQESISLTAVVSYKMIVTTNTNRNQ